MQATWSSLSPKLVTSKFALILAGVALFELTFQSVTVRPNAYLPWSRISGTPNRPTFPFANDDQVVSFIPRGSKY
jgi:hypothetical protein